MQVHAIGQQRAKRDLELGRMVELASTEELFSAPKHPYTAALLSAVPEPDPRVRSQRIVLQGEVANPAAPPSGCYFHPARTPSRSAGRRRRPGKRSPPPISWAATGPTSSSLPGVE
jgi:peptide/nickel transport system ATP-binding protein